MLCSFIQRGTRVYQGARLGRGSSDNLSTSCGGGDQGCQRGRHSEFRSHGRRHTVILMINDPDSSHASWRLSGPILNPAHFFNQTQNASQKNLRYGTLHVGGDFEHVLPGWARPDGLPGEPSNSSPYGLPGEPNNSSPPLLSSRKPDSQGLGAGAPLAAPPTSHPLGCLAADVEEQSAQEHGVLEEEQSQHVEEQSHILKTHQTTLRGGEFPAPEIFHSIDLAVGGRGNGNDDDDVVLTENVDQNSSTMSTRSMPQQTRKESDDEIYRRLLAQRAERVSPQKPPGGESQRAASRAASLRRPSATPYEGREKTAGPRSVSRDRRYLSPQKGAGVNGGSSGIGGFLGPSQSSRTPPPPAAPTAPQQSPLRGSDHFPNDARASGFSGLSSITSSSARKRFAGQTPYPVADYQQRRKNSSSSPVGAAQRRNASASARNKSPRNKSPSRRRESLEGVRRASRRREHVWGSSSKSPARQRRNDESSVGRGPGWAAAAAGELAGGTSRGTRRDVSRRRSSPVKKKQVVV